MTFIQSVSAHTQVPVRIILADDHPVVLLGARMALEAITTLPLSVVAQASSPAELIFQLEHEPCDLLITDYSMPICRQPDGLALISYIHRNYKNTKIMVMTMARSNLLMQHLLTTGVRGVFDKHRPLDELSQAVTSVLKGEKYLSPSLESNIKNIKNGIPRQLKLTPKEYEVIRLLGEGLAGREIAKRLNRSEKTISRQKRSAMQKQGIYSESESRDAEKKVNP